MNTHRYFSRTDILSLVIVAGLVLWLAVFSLPAVMFQSSSTLTPTAAFQVPSSKLTPTPTWNVKPGTLTATPLAKSGLAAPQQAGVVVTAIALPTATPTPTPTNTPTRTVTPTPTRTFTPTRTATPTPRPPTPTPLPPTATPVPPTPTPLPIDWDGRLSFLRVANIPAQAAPGQPYWRLISARFQDWKEGGGSHSIYIDVRDENGARLTLSEGTTVGMVSGGGEVALQWGAKPANEHPINYPMYGGLGGYSVWITLDGLPSDRVAGMGLVATDAEANLLAEPGKVHVNYLLTFQKSRR